MHSCFAFLYRLNFTIYSLLVSTLPNISNYFPHIETSLYLAHHSQVTVRLKYKLMCRYECNLQTYLTSLTQHCVSTSMAHNTPLMNARSWTSHTCHNTIFSKTSHHTLSQYCSLYISFTLHFTINLIWLSSQI